MFDTPNIFSVAFELKATIPVVLLPTIVAFTISIHLSIPPCSLSSKVGSIALPICLILPCIAPHYKGLHCGKTGVPWQMKSILIIIQTPSKMQYYDAFCRDMPPLFWACLLPLTGTEMAK